MGVRKFLGQPGLIASPAGAASLEAHIRRLKRCRLCPAMASAPVPPHPVQSPVLLLGQAPGRHEPRLGRPFAWTAGRTLFRWFYESCGLDEAGFRSVVYMAAVCRCFPGRTAAGGDRVPTDGEVANCARWLDAEIGLLQPRLVIPTGRLAISTLLGPVPLVETVGRTSKITRAGIHFDTIPLPHPSGASPWHRMEPGRTLLTQALCQIARHSAMKEVVKSAAAR